MRDYFTFMGLARTLALDEAALQQRYYELSREYHPDFHTNASEADRAASLERSSVLNQAYRTLKDPYERARYLLGLEWPDLPDADRKRIPPSLLMEVMEMQETIADAQNETDAVKRAERDTSLQDIERRLKEKMAALGSELEGIAGEWPLIADGPQEAKRPLLERLNLLLNTRNYLRTLLATIDAVRTGVGGVRH